MRGGDKIEQRNIIHARVKGVEHTEYTKGGKVQKQT